MKRIVSILISLAMGLSCAVSFIGCSKNPDNSSSLIEDGASGDSDSSVIEVDLSKELDEYLPVAEMFTSNIENISVADIKNSEGDVLSLLFNGVTVGNIFKNFMQYGSDDSPIVIEINRYKDGKWRCGAKATEIDSDLNLIFEYQLFSGPLNIAQDHLEVVKDKHILDLLMESVFNTNFSIEKTLDMMEKQGESGTGAGTVSLPMMPGFDSLTENKAVYEFVKPLLLLTIGDFYEITLDYGASYIQNTYGTMDVDSYIKLYAYALAASGAGDFESLSALICDLINGTISAPVINGDLEVSQLIDEVLALVGIDNADLTALLKTSFAGTVSQPEFVGLNSVEIFVANVGRLLTLCNVDAAQVETIKNLLNDLLVNGEQGGVEINSNQKVAKLVEYLPVDESIKAVMKDQFGEMTIGELLSTPKAFCDKIDSVIAAIKESISNSTEEVSAEITAQVENFEALFAIIKKYVTAEDVTAFGLIELFTDLATVCNLILPADISGNTAMIFDVLGSLVQFFLPEGVTIGGAGAAIGALDFDSTVGQLGELVKQLLGDDESSAAMVDSFVALIQMFANGIFSELQFNYELTVVEVIDQVKSILTAFGVENEIATKILNKLSVWYAETLVIGMVDDTLNLEVDGIIEAAFGLIAYANIVTPEKLTVIENALTLLFCGTLGAPQINSIAMNMTVADFMEEIGGSEYLEKYPMLQNFADFTLGQLFYYNFGKNDQLDEVVVETLKELALALIGRIDGDTTTTMAIAA